MPDVPVTGPRKPAIDSPCNGCGLCCVATPCLLALDYVPGAVEGEPCPALEWSAGRSWCGLVTNPSKHAPGRPGALTGSFVRHLLGDGTCDSGPRPDEAPEDDCLGMTAAEYLAEHPAS